MISIHAEKAFDEIQCFDTIQHPFMILKKFFNKLGIAVTIIKAICNKPKTNVILNGEKLKTFPPR